MTQRTFRTVGASALALLLMAIALGTVQPGAHAQLLPTDTRCDNDTCAQVRIDDASHPPNRLDTIAAAIPADAILHWGSAPILVGSCPAGSAVRDVALVGGALSTVCEPDDGGTSYTAGNGLILTGTAFSADTAFVQSRVAATCGPESSIRGIAQGGTVTCEADDNAGGDVTGVTAGTGLTGGGINGDVTVAVDSGSVQSRVTATCAAGSSIRAIAQTGSVTCESDDDSGGDVTGVTAGAGLTGGGSAGDVTLSADDSILQSRVAASCAPGSSIRAISQSGSVTCETDDGGVPQYTGPMTFIENGVTYSVESPVVWTGNSHLYLRVLPSLPVTWIAARDAARTAGGHLATVTSAAEQTFIQTNLLDSHGGYIGYTDVRVEGGWEWVTGEIAPLADDLLFANWQGAEPNNNGNEDFAAMTSTGGWIDIPAWRTDLASAFFVEISNRESGG